MCFRLTLVLVELKAVDSSLLGHGVTEEFPAGFRISSAVIWSRSDHPG